MWQDNWKETIRWKYKIEDDETNEIGFVRCVVHPIWSKKKTSPSYNHIVAASTSLFLFNSQVKSMYKNGVHIVHKILNIIWTHDNQWIFKTLLQLKSIKIALYVFF